MKKALVIISAAILFPVIGVFAQCKPMIKIDGKATVVNPNDDFGIRFPFWMTSGQTLAVGSSVSSISIIEFEENGISLEYSGVLSFTSSSPVQVPSGKVWKLESAQIDNNSSTYKRVTFSAGTYAWQVPACAEEICIEVWGGGGGGSGNWTSGGLSSGAGGGGGGFGSGCFVVAPGTPFSITVGQGGAGGAANANGANGGNTNVGSLISATGGLGGTISSTGGAGGAGGTSPALSNAPGASGSPGIPSTNPAASGRGGAAGNGGEGGESASGSAGNGLPGSNPGGGGSGGQRFNSSGYTGGKGGDGRVIISW